MNNQTSEIIPAYRIGQREVVKKVVNEETGRETWKVDLEVYDKKAEEDAIIDGTLSRTTKTLQQRTESLQLEKDLGKQRVVYKDGAKKDQIGYFCQLCDYNCTDSNTWLDHLNSQKHNRLLGMNMNVEKTQVDKIKEKFASLKKSREPDQKNKETIQREIKEKIEQKFLKKEEQKKSKKEKKLEKIAQKQDNDDNDEDPEIQELKKFGLPMSFSKQSKS